jgi:AIPR protein
MANNDQVLLDIILDEQRRARTPTASESDFFEQYAAEQILKDFDLSDEEIEYGLTGGGGDGGIDGMYTFANGELVQEDFDHSTLKKNISIDVFIIQSKTSNGFDESSINKLIAVTGDLFELSRPIEDYLGVYNDGIRSAVRLFRELYVNTAGRFPAVRFSYAFVAKGADQNVHQNVVKRSDALKLKIQQLFPQAKFEFLFKGATDLLTLARRQPTTSFELRFSESLTGRDGYIALVRLQDFFQFIRSENGLLRKILFDANVRDYQGSNQVNEEMHQTLVGGGPEEFWWLNNGVTVVANRAVVGGKALTIEDPQIVNGQQTSTEIFNYCNVQSHVNDDRCVMVRVIVATDATSRDRIIKATNSQTSIPPSSLRATEKIHRDIEEYLAPFGVYYDRRKNSQKQLGRPTDKIISIAMLSQAMMSIVLQRPDDARARPSTLIKKDDDYSSIFNDSFPIQIFLVAARLVKVAHATLRARSELTPKDRNNLLFYVTMNAATILSGLAKPTSASIARIDPVTITSELMQSSINQVSPLYAALGANDQVAKGKDMLRDLKKFLAKKYDASIQSSMGF